MKEKYESLSLATLKDLAKARGLKGISTMRKPELIERMLEEDRKEQTAENEQTISGTAEENTIPARPEPVAAEKTENTGSVSNGENRPENFVKRTPVAKPVEVVPPAELRPEETEQPRTGAASENRTEEGVSNAYNVPAETVQLDSGEKANGILEVMPDGFGFIRSENYLPGENDIYVSPSQIRRFNLKTGDIIQGNIRIKTQGEKFSALLYVTSINGFHPSEGQKRYNFENMTPIFPDERLIMERPGGTTAMRIVDLISPIGKGQRGMIVSPPKAGKTTLLKDVAKSILKNNKDMHLIILLIDERPEEVTDIREAIQGPNVEVIYSTFDELPEHHKRVSEMVVERARRLVEHKQDVVILLDPLPDWQEPITWLFLQAEELCQEVLIREHFICRSASLVQHVICVREEALPFWPLHWLTPEVKWTTLFTKNSREPAIWSLFLTASFRRNGFSRPSTFRNPVPDEKICF